MHSIIRLGSVITLAMYATAFTILAIHVALAADALPAADGVISIPWGQWLGDVLDWAGTIILAAIAWALRKLPAGIYAIIQQLRVEQLLERAVSYGINAAAGAAKGKTLDITVTETVIELAADYAISNAPALVNYLGPDTLRAKILARLAVDEDVSAIDVGADIVPQS